ncbi:hypothetical protein [Micrococcus sp. FDAARGOS_333]|uniref:hypothetical protein n=1 Tax=Micrococcus sp. FDAARGOS_333 TaxID=1930558 RepID=UPI001D0FFF5C|nr:hypothetical protein [Micrococcus sp. FDAARGOS_333]
MSNVYTGNDARAGKIIKAIEDKVSDLDDMRALAFCVTVEHAKYMADKFNEAGIPRLSSLARRIQTNEHLFSAGWRRVSSRSCVV